MPDPAHPARSWGAACVVLLLALSLLVWGAGYTVTITLAGPHGEVSLHQHLPSLGVATRLDPTPHSATSPLSVPHSVTATPLIPTPQIMTTPPGVPAPHSMTTTPPSVPTASVISPTTHCSPPLRVGVLSSWQQGPHAKHFMHYELLLTVFLRATGRALAPLPDNAPLERADVIIVFQYDLSGVNRTLQLLAPHAHRAVTIFFPTENRDFYLHGRQFYDEMVDAVDISLGRAGSPSWNTAPPPAEAAIVARAAAAPNFVRTPHWLLFTSQPGACAMHSDFHSPSSAGPAAAAAWSARPGFALHVAHHSPYPRGLLFSALSDLAKELSGDRRVGAPSTAFHNMEWPEMADKAPGEDNKAALLRTYRFNLQPENSRSRNGGYVTEKVPNALRAGAVPITWGDPMDGEGRVWNPARILVYGDAGGGDLRLPALLARVRELDTNATARDEFFAQPVLLPTADTYVEEWCVRVGGLINAALDAKSATRTMVTATRTAPPAGVASPPPTTSTSVGAASSIPPPTSQSPSLTPAAASPSPSEAASPLPPVAVPPTPAATPVLPCAQPAQPRRPWQRPTLTPTPTMGGSPWPSPAGVDDWLTAVERAAARPPPVPWSGATCPRSPSDFPLPNNTLSLQSCARPAAPVDLCVQALRGEPGPWDAVTPATVKAWFVNYGTPSFANSRLRSCRQANATRYFDELRCLTPTDLPPEWVVGNKAVLRQARGAGYWAWKPVVLSVVLAEMGWGDVLVYLDAGSTLKKSPHAVVAAALGGGGALASRCRDSQDQKVSKFTKSDMLAAMRPALWAGGGQPLAALLAADMMAGGFIVLQKRPWTVALVNEWIWWAGWPGLSNDSPSNTPNAVNFVEHRHDQSLWSQLVLMHDVDSRLMGWSEVVDHTRIKGL